MGDRGNVFFVDGKQGKRLAGMYMYSHWGGAGLPDVVRAGLKRGKDRWGDSQYLARIVFCELIRDSVLDDTGYGLGTQIGDNEHRIIRVDDLAGRVSYHEPGREQSATDKGVASWTYAEYLTAKNIYAEFADEPEEEAEPATLPVATAKKPKKTPKRAPTKKTKKTKGKRGAA